MRSPTLAVVFLAALGSCSPQDRPGPTADHRMGGPRMPGACEAASAANAGKLGCYFDVAIEIGTLSAPVFWHVFEFSDAASARRVTAPGAAIVYAYGRVFLQAVNSDPHWRAAGGNHLATVGPMPAPQGVPVTARFMQAMTQPGANTRPHRHDGPEAFYLLSGAICMETPEGGRTTGPGETYWVRGGVPMQLTSAGNGVRRSLFVVLHASSQPWMTMAPDWAPTGACG